MIDHTEKYCFIRTLSYVGGNILLGNDERQLFKKKNRSPARIKCIGTSLFQRRSLLRIRE